MTPIRLSALEALRRHRDLAKLAAMIFLFFLVVFSIGVLRPVRNAFALGGLADTEFYKVYFVSAVVVLFVPIYNRLSDRIQWKHLIPGVAVFFSVNLVVFRLLYVEGSAAFGMALYGWYDLLAAALVTQFFIATQIFFNARDAKRAYPLVIAGGSIGATLGGAITGFFAERVGTANLLLVAAGAIMLFAVLLWVVWAQEDPEAGRTREALEEETELSIGEFRRIFRNPHVRLIAATVLMTVLTKQLVDYEFNTLTERALVEVDRISAFQGKFYAATQWMPILVLAALRPILTRWGLGVAVLIFPVAMLLTTGGLALVWGLWAAVAAKGADTTFRYSAERTGREVLYVPVPDEVKLKAKAYIDVALEKGVGKASSAVLILGLLSVMGVREIAFVAFGLASLLTLAALAVRKEYVHSLARSIQGRFASLKSTFASLAGTTTISLVRDALESDEPLKVAFALDLLERADTNDLSEMGVELHRLLGHRSEQIRRRALDQLARIPGEVDRSVVRERLFDEDGEVREAAVRALALASRRSPEALLAELLEEEDPKVRAATLACLAHDIEPETAESIVRPFFERRRAEAEEHRPGAPLELATAAGLMHGDPGVVPLLKELMQDDDPEVASAALRSAGQLGSPELLPSLIAALADPRTRPAARDALAAQGEDVLEPLVRRLNDRAADPRVRRSIPSVLTALPSQTTVDALIDSYLLPDTDQVLDDRTLKALNKLRARHSDLRFDRDRVMRALQREIDATENYLEALVVTERIEGEHTSVRMLARALREARGERRESIFRWLGLVYPPDGMYRCYLALTGGSDRARANAIEWLDTTVGHALFRRLRPALRRAPEVEPPPEGPAPTLRALWDDEDHWIARCAMWAMAEAGFPSTEREVRRFDPGDPGLQRIVQRLRARYDGGPSEEAGDEMDLIEKVFLLQNVDLLRGARSGQLALLGQIARVVEVDADKVLIRRGEPTDALYVVIDGEVELEGVGGHTLTVSDGSPFGTWALIDEEPSLVEARTLCPTRLLRIRRVDFHDLLSDHAELGLDLLRGLARRVRTLAQG